VYKSDDGETWERATDNEFNESSDSQAGDVNTVVIDATDVYIMFTSGIKTDETSQHSRLHNIEVWGEPGGGYVGVESLQENKILIYSEGSGLFRIEGDYTQLMVYNTVGAVVYSQVGNNQNIINLSGAPKGIYIVRARDLSGEIVVRKILNN
jgi:hypothetical protein